MEDIKAKKFRDMMYNQSGNGVRAAAFHTLTRASKKPEALAAGIALILVVVCKKYRVKPQEVLEMAARIYNEGESLLAGDERQFHLAVANYVANELPDVT